MFRGYLRALSLALLAVWMLAGCSHGVDGESQEPAVDILSRFNADGKAWLCLQIPLGNTGATNRAMSLDGFKDGDGDEYAVNDVYVLIFSGANETAATLAGVYKVTPTFETSAYEQITYKAMVLIDDQNINTGDNLYTFVLLNNNSSAISGYTSSTVTFANGGSPKTLNNESTLDDLQAITIANHKDESGYFLMTNARLADAATTSANLSTLVEMPATYFFSTQAEAEANPAAHVNVERLAAKTTVTSGLVNMYVLGNEYATFENSDLTFALDNYNTKSYVCCHLSGVTYPRFVESEVIEPYYPYRYRTYWSEDFNYSGKDGLSFKTDPSAISWNALDQVTYCAENTFDVAHQQDDCTTSVLVRLQLNNGTDFYTTSVTGQDVIFQSPSSTITEEGTSGDEAFARRSVLVPYDGTSTATIDDYLRTWLMQNHSGFRSWVNTYAAGEPRHVQISVTGNATTGVAIVSSVTQTARGEGTTGATAFAALHLEDYLASHISLKYYANGYCYYRVHIRHFTDEETPWSSVSSMTANTTAQVYGSDAEHYLGRYGMLRNHWYTVNIKSVTHVGSPIIPALTTNADDAIEQLLNATLTISGWESHSQDL
ncbi:MAG: Mfa1 fimbrilin C-terminal domain-containing protein [Prevotella sp.]|nr:Mfa1 fimbrilin C-terminal domain-containing protein [Prevotella sp.]